MIKYSAILAVVILSGCASNSSNIIPIGKEVFTVSASRPILGVGYSKGAQEAVYYQATTFCEEKGKKTEIIQFEQNPSALGRAANATLQFKCVGNSDPKK